MASTTSFSFTAETPSHTAMDLSGTDLISLTESVELVSQDWPSLTPEKEDWEMVAPTIPGGIVAGAARTSPIVTFDVSALQAQGTGPDRNGTELDCHRNSLIHAQSSPDFRAWVVPNDDDDDDDGVEEGDTSSAVFVEEDPSFLSDLVSVSGPPSVWSMNSTHNKLSFKDVLQQSKSRSAIATTCSTSLHPSAQNTAAPSKPTTTKKTSFRTTTFEVVKPQSQTYVAGLKRNSQSMGNLRALDHIQEEILGDTDADLFYSQKAMGAKGRVNGQRIRPDEAKRLEITMNKKNMQRQRQQRR